MFTGYRHFLCRSSNTFVTVHADLSETERMLGVKYIRLQNLK